MRIASMRWRSSPIAARRRRSSRMLSPASTRIRVFSVASSAAFPELPLANTQNFKIRPPPSTLQHTPNAPQTEYPQNVCSFLRQVVNLRRIGNPPAATGGEAANTGGLAAASPGRINNPPQVGNLPHEGFRRVKLTSLFLHDTSIWHNTMTEHMERLSIFLAGSILAPTFCFGQAGRAELFGTIQDPSSRPVPGAKVEAEDQDR